MNSVVPSPRKGPAMSKERTGKFGRPGPATFQNLPPYVAEKVERFRSNEEKSDWVMFVDKPYGQLWIVTRTWDDDKDFTIIAAKVEHEEIGSI